jgi:hypothetical protein
MTGKAKRHEQQEQPSKKTPNVGNLGQKEAGQERKRDADLKHMGERSSTKDEE